MKHKPRRHALKVVAEAIEQRILLSTVSNGIVQATTDPTGVSSKLLAIANGTANSQQLPSYIYDSSGRIDVKITADDVNALAAPLEAVGFSQTGIAPADHFIEGFIPPGALKTINSLTSSGMMGVLPIDKPQLSTGAVESEGDSILEADRTRAVSGFTGSGVTVGVLSDSYNDLGTASSDVASGDLPANVNVLSDLPNGGTDEGRAMMQIVHDLAPGSNLAFATAFNGEASFAQNIEDLAAPVSSGGAGANVIVDDAYYFDEPFFQDGVIAQAINTVESTDNVSYFSAAGNEGTQSYESANVGFYSDTLAGISSSPGRYYNFNPTGSADDRESISLNNYQSLDIGFEWDQPYYTTSGVTSQINLYLLNSSGTLVASATDNVIADQEPYQELYYENQTGTNASYSLVISLASGPTPGRIKFVDYGDGYNVSFNNYFTNSSTITPHAGASGAFAVAAAPAYSQRVLESYSSQGPFTELFDASGNRLASPVIRAKPDVTAIDGVSTTFFGGTGYSGHPQFYGTSAAAPHAAAVAALIKCANPSWTPAQIYADLKSTADPNIGTGNPNFIGAGLIDAFRAVEGAAVPVVADVNDGFESGSLGRDWTVYNSGAGQTEVETGNSPQTGNDQLVENGIAENYPYPVLSEAILNLSVPSYVTNVTLYFAQKKFYSSSYAGSELDYPMPATFTGHGNYDGVALSVDGTHWYSLISLTGSNSTTAYQNNTFNLSQIAAVDGLTLGATTQIKFQYYDAASFQAPNGGFAFDNVQVAASVSLVGPQFYLRRDPSDSSQMDIFASNNATGSLYAELPTTLLQSYTITGTGSPESVTLDYRNGFFSPTGITFNASGSALNNQLIVMGIDNHNDAVISAAGSLSFDGVVNTTNDVGTNVFIPGNGTGSLIVNSGTLTLAPRSNPGITTENFSSIQLNQGAALVIAQPVSHATRALVVTGQLTLSSNASGWSSTLDLTGNDLAITGTANAATLNSQLASGFAKGAWNGTGIDSSFVAADTTHLTALAEISNSTDNGMTALYGSGTALGLFDGFNPGSSAILVKYTYQGDADLSGKVDATDYSRVDSGFTTHATGWLNGDFNYDGVVNGSDYTLIDNAFNRQRASLASQVDASVVSQPLAVHRRVNTDSHIQTPPVVSISSMQIDSIASAIFQPQSAPWWSKVKKARTFFA